MTFIMRIAAYSLDTYLYFIAVLYLRVNVLVQLYLELDDLLGCQKKFSLFLTSP